MGRYFESYEPSAEELERVAQLAPNACPRRYCWWWHSLNFDWHLDAAEGCTWPAADKPQHWLLREYACCRADPSSPADSFEPRGPHLEADNIDPTPWIQHCNESNDRLLKDDCSGST